MSLPRTLLEKIITAGCVFVETGARWGDTVIRAAELGAGVVFSCEHDRIMAAIAASHVEDALARVECDVSIEHCDSVEFLRSHVKDADVVFLDAHTDSHSPVLQELEALGAWEKKPRIIVIDDLRCMKSWGIDRDALLAALYAVGPYSVAWEDGVARGDILVARLR